MRANNFGYEVTYLQVSICCPLLPNPLNLYVTRFFIKVFVCKLGLAVQQLIIVYLGIY